jgi:hypothetical protein
MALPRIIAMTLVRKSVQNDGNVLLAFEVKLEDEGAGSLGYARLVVNAGAADDFAVGSEFTFTGTAGD